MNNCIFHGVLLQDPELRYTTENQTAVCTSYLQFIERTKEAKPSTIKVVAWGKLADAFRELSAGTKVLLEGSLRSHQKENPAGYKEKLWELNISRMEKISTSSSATPASTSDADEDEDEDDDDFPD